MLNISYTRIADLIADFKAGVKFVVSLYGGKTTPVNEIVETSDRGFRVVTSLNTYRHFRLDGTNRNNSVLRLMKVEKTIERTFPFSSYQALVEAHKQGVQFEVKYIDRTLAVSAIELKEDAHGYYVLVKNADGGSWAAFKLNGSHGMSGARLVVKEALPVPTAEAPAKAAVAPSATGWPYPTGVAQVAPVPQKSFLERFMSGETFHSPKTGEVVASVGVRSGHRVLEVTLKDPETGKTRVTPRYNLDGTHKFQSDRNLTAGQPPKRPKQVKVTVYKHAYNGTLFVIRDGEVLPNIRGISNATKVGNTTITE